MTMISPSETSVSAADLRKVMSHYLTGVTIVTASNGTAWQAAPNGVPLLASAAAQLECSVHARIDAEYQEILLGLVESYTHHPTAPLNYCRGSFFAAPRPEVTT